MTDDLPRYKRSMRTLMEACITEEELDRVVVHFTLGYVPEELPRQEIVNMLREVSRAKGWKA